MTIGTDTKKLLIPAQAAVVLGMSSYTLNSSCTKKCGPDWIALSTKTIRYDSDEVTKFLYSFQLYEVRHNQTLGRQSKVGGAA